MIEILLAKALICFAGQCHPVLAGDRTPVGIHAITEMSTDLPGYGGSVLSFMETDTTVFAIHRVYPFDKRMDRAQVLKVAGPFVRRRVTNGCINVEPSVYDQLVVYVKTDPIVTIK